MLRYLQSVIVTGRNIEIEDTSQILEGITNFIVVDRNNILVLLLMKLILLKTLEQHLKCSYMMRYLNLMCILF